MADKNFQVNKGLTVANTVLVTNGALVGINNTNPTVALHVTGDSSISGNLAVTKIVANSALGTATQVLSANATGGLYWAKLLGSNTQILFTDSATANGSAGLTFIKTSNTLTVGNTVLAATVNATTVNAATHSVGTAVVANATGVYTTGTVNAATISTTDATISGNLAITKLVANSNIGLSTQVLMANGSGGIYWAYPSVVPTPGDNTQVLFNDSGTSGATAGLTFNKSSNTLLLYASATQYISHTLSSGYPSITISGNATHSPATVYLNQSAAANNKYWQEISSGTQYILQAINDAFNVANVAMQATRSGMNITSVVFPSGNVSVGTSSTASSKLLVSGGSLGTTGSSVINAFALYDTTSNADYLNFYQVRNSTGSDWTTAAWRIQHKVDTTDMAYIQFNGNNLNQGLAFGTTNTERMRITPSGDVGIGTTIPAATLHVTAATPTTPSLTWGATAGQIFRNENSELAIGLSSSTPYPLYLQGRRNSNTAWDIVLQPLGGSVGIGTTSPAFKLDVSDTNAIIRSKGTSGYGGFVAEGSGTNPGYVFFKNAGGENARIYSDSNTMYFTTTPSANIRMTISSTGNVGIGTTNPVAPLTVASGSAQYTTTMYLLPSTHATSRRTTLSIDDWQLMQDTSGNGTKDFSIFQGSTVSHRFSINNVGQVGIGTTTPGAGVKLDVVGLAAVDYLRVDPQDATNEGGEIQLAGAGVYGSAYIDNYQGNMRIHGMDAGKIFQVNADIASTGDVISAYSDERLKTIQGKIPDALNKVKTLEGFYYQPNQTAIDLGVEDGKMQVGVSAQQVQKILPEIIRKSAVGEDYLTVQYERLVPLLIEAIKELTEKVEKLENGS